MSTVFEPGFFARLVILVQENSVCSKSGRALCLQIKCKILWHPHSFRCPVKARPWSDVSQEAEPPSLHFLHYEEEENLNTPVHFIFPTLFYCPNTKFGVMNQCYCQTCVMRITAMQNQTRLMILWKPLGWSGGCLGTKESIMRQCLPPITASHHWLVNW